jgi:hypothetical protein
MATIYDLVNAKNIADFYTNNPSNKIPYLGATLFPTKKQLGLDLGWIKGSNGLPVALTPSAFDAKATLRDRIGFSEIKTEMPFFREGMRMGEKDRQDLLRLLASPGLDEMQRTAITKIYEDKIELVKGAAVQPERMIMQLLSTGMINISANRVPYTYDYKLQAGHKETLLTTARWSQSGSTPIQDIIRWQDLVEADTGVRPTNAIMTRKTWGYLMNHASIRLDMNPLGGQNTIMTDSVLRGYLLDKLGLQVAVYNKKYKAEDGSLKSFFPDEVVTFFPEGKLGNTYYGTTPEEADLMSGGTDAQVQIVDTGVAITTIKEPHPVNVQTIVSEIVLPSFETIDNIFVATVG